MQDLLTQLDTLTEACRDQTVVDAKRLQNPLLELHATAVDLGEAATAPIEALLRATTTRTLLSTSELEDLADSLRQLVAAN